MASKTQMAALFLTERLSPARGDVGHGEGEAELAERVAALVADQVDLDEPGVSSFHSAQVRMGIWDLSSVPGLVWERPRGTRLARWAGQVPVDGGGLMDTSRAASSSLSTISPSRRSSGTTDVEHGGQALAGRGRVSIQHVARQAITWAGDFGAPAPGAWTTLSAPAWRRAARAWSRCQPVSSTSSSRIRDLSGLVPRL